MYIDEQLAAIRVPPDATLDAMVRPQHRPLVEVDALLFHEQIDVHGNRHVRPEVGDEVVTRPFLQIADAVRWQFVARHLILPDVPSCHQSTALFVRRSTAGC